MSAASPVTNRCRGILDRNLLAAAVQQQSGLGQFNDAVVAQAAKDRTLDRRASDFVQHLEHLGYRAAHRFGDGPAGQLLGDRVQIFDQCIGVGGEYRVADRLQRDLRLLLFFGQLDFGQLAGADVCERAFVAGNVAVRSAQHTRVLEHRDDAAVATTQLVLGTLHPSLAPQGCQDPLPVGGVCVQQGR